LTKLDGSAKGGAAFAVSADLGLPVAYVGTGETVEDLKVFSATDFVRNLVP
ncbi:MAG: signal recognition particle-docking protein FtsY, partial [Bdellovibrionota bacterium]